MQLSGCTVLSLVLLLMASPPATAQQVTTTQPMLVPALEGQVAQSSVGQVGQRQTREQTAPNTPPMNRIASRLQTRIQSRLRTRIDRLGAPPATPLTAFIVAEEEARTKSSPR